MIRNTKHLKKTNMKWVVTNEKNHLFIGGHYVYKAIKVKNVCDEMYYGSTAHVKSVTATSISR